MESRRGPRRPRPTISNSFFDNAYNNSLTGNEFNTVNGNQSKTTNNDNRRTKNRYEGADNRRWERTWNDNRYASGVNNGANGTVNFGYVPQRESSPHDQNPRRSPGYNPGYSSGLNAETQPEEPPSFLDPTYQAYQRSQQRAGSVGESQHSDSDYDSDTPHQNSAHFTRGDRNNGNPQPNQLHSGFSQATAYAYPPDTVIEQRPDPLNDHSQRQPQDFNVGVQEAYSDLGQVNSLYPAGAAQNHDNDTTNGHHDSGINPEPFHETISTEPKHWELHFQIHLTLVTTKMEPLMTLIIMI
ncbi:hypothetical protein VKT23_011781 [Stygiomarasmius scandens]|uniref:Enamelin n=1 Tax=Marasmiellus scandens TaxID=2682957 RepID=A0ABR1JAN0_9AGAR